MMVSESEKQSLVVESVREAFGRHPDKTFNTCTGWSELVCIVCDARAPLFMAILLPSGWRNTAPAPHNEVQGVCPSCLTKEEHPQ